MRAGVRHRPPSYRWHNNLPGTASRAGTISPLTAHTWVCQPAGGGAGMARFLISVNIWSSPDHKWFSRLRSSPRRKLLVIGGEARRGGAKWRWNGSSS